MKQDELKYSRKGFLLLKRKEGQGFFIDKDTEIIISKINDGSVYVAIKAPNKRVVRQEIADKEPRKVETIS